MVSKHIQKNIISNISLCFFCILTNQFDRVIWTSATGVIRFIVYVCVWFTSLWSLLNIGKHSIPIIGFVDHALVHFVCSFWLTVSCALTYIWKKNTLNIHNKSKNDGKINTQFIFCTIEQNKFVVDVILYRYYFEMLWIVCLAFWLCVPAVRFWDFYINKQFGE